MRDFIRDYNERHGADRAADQSHYMDDVVALCPRVIVIDHGQLIYDGDLRALVRRDARPTSASRSGCRRRSRAADLARLGTVVSADAAQAVLSVPSRAGERGRARRARARCRSSTSPSRIRRSRR